MGFNNHGAAAAVPRLEREAGRGIRPVIGVNIGKRRVVDVDDAIPDYLESTRLLAPHADYLVGQRELARTRRGSAACRSSTSSAPLLEAVRDAASARGPRETPVLVKIAPDLTTTRCCDRRARRFD